MLIILRLNIPGPLDPVRVGVGKMPHYFVFPFPPVGHIQMEIPTPPPHNCFDCPESV
jgi:hypothetical protein